MPRFFIEPFSGDIARISGEDARHIAKSLRMVPGEELILCDGCGYDYKGEILSLDSSETLVQVMEQYQTQSEPSVKVTLFQAMPKGEKLDMIVQKAVELGVFEIVPVLTSRCISRPDEKSMKNKIVRLQKIALAAAKQSGRGMVPTIKPALKFEQAVACMKAFTRAILFYEHAQRPLSGILQHSDTEIAIMIGPEGGFSPEEADHAETNEIALAGLGRRILRCETAPVCALSAIMYAAGEF